MPQKMLVQGKMRVLGGSVIPLAGQMRRLSALPHFPATMRSPQLAVRSATRQLHFTARAAVRNDPLPDNNTATAENAVDEDTCDWKAMLWEALHAAAPPSRFACSGRVDTTKIPWMGPDISVAGVGRLSLPLSKEQAMSLKAVAEQAPYGKGLQTVVDTTVRDAFQIDASQITTGSSWERVMDTFVPNMMHALELSAAAQAPYIAATRQHAPHMNRYSAFRVEARLYKMLLYEQGGHFTPHRDTEKEPGMFGTLVVQLPTAEGHRGGSLAVRHKAQEFTHHFAEDSTSSLQYAAFYADCEHELSPITSGTRLVLVYNLVWRGRPSEAPQLFSKSPAQVQLAQALRAWERDITAGGEQKRIAFLLDHQYTEQNLSFDHLKGTDRAWGRAVATCKGFDAHLVLVVRRVHGGDGYKIRYVPYERRRRADQYEYEDGRNNNGRLRELHEIAGIWHDEVETGKWVTLDGSQVEYGDVDADTDLYDPWFDELFLEDDEPDDEEYKAHTGNSGPDVYQIYRRALLVLWPRSYSMALAQRAGFKAVLALLKLRLWEVSAVYRGNGDKDGQQQPQQTVTALEKQDSDDSISAARADARAALQHCVDLVEDSRINDSNKTEHNIPLLLQQGAKAVQLGIEEAAEVLQKVLGLATDLTNDLADTALASALAEAAVVLESAAVEPLLKPLVARCMAPQAESCITLIKGVSAQQKLQSQLASAALAAAPATMVEQLLSLAVAVPDLPTVQQHVIDKLVDALAGPQQGDVLKQLVVSLHKLNGSTELQQQLKDAAATTVMTTGALQYLDSCPQLIRACAQQPQLREQLVQAVATALRIDWPLQGWQASTALQLLEVLRDTPSQLSMIRSSITEALFDNTALLSSQTDDSMLRVWELLLSNKQLIALRYSHFTTAVTQRPDSYSLLRQLLPSPRVKARLLTPEVQQLVACQIANLERMLLVPIPAFSWNMPDARLPNYPQVESFLQGPNEEFTLTGFADWDHACAIAEQLSPSGFCRFEDLKSWWQHGIDNGDYSFEAHVDFHHQGQRLCIKITKTRRWWERLVKFREQLKKDLKDAKCLRRRVE